MEKIPALYSDLIKYKLSLAVVLSAVTGYFIFNNSSDSHLLFLALGVFFLASGSAVLNQYTERAADSLMERTRNRPIPSGKISERKALLVCILLFVSGSFFLFLNGLIPMMLGLINVLLYNLVYTSLKKRTVFSIIPGALVGAIPPVIGFTSAGGYSFQPEIIAFSGFMFLWQLPHFWLIIIKYGNEYKTAGFATISSYLNELQIRILVFFWVLLSTLFLFLFYNSSDTLSREIFVLLSVLNIAFILLFYRMLFIKTKAREIRGAFIMINSFSLVIMFLIIVLSVLKN